MMSRKNRAGQLVELRKALVERHDLDTLRRCKRCQVRIIPDFRRKARALSVVSPPHFQTDRFGLKEANSRISVQRIENIPAFGQRNRFILEDTHVRQQAQESLLSHPTKADAIIGLARKPMQCTGMARMHGHRQRQPKVHISEKFLCHSETRQSCRWLSVECRDSWNAPTETVLFSVGEARREIAPASNAKRQRFRQPNLHRAAARRHHFVQHIEFPFLYYGPRQSRRQARILRGAS